MNYADIQEARAEAERQIRLADRAVFDALLLVVGRLRQALPNPQHYGNYTAERRALGKLKKELRNFDSVRNCWKDAP